jgi:hypothetical protein
MTYVGTPEFESRRPALKAAFDQGRQEFEARLALVEAETAPPADVMSPEEFVSRLVVGDVPKE